MSDVDGTAIDRLTAALEGRYRIEKEVGAGGMATVVAAAGRFVLLRRSGGSVEGDGIVVEGFVEELKARIRR